MKWAKLHAFAKFFSPLSLWPTYLLLFVTSRCEAACDHCFYWKRRNSNEKELTLAEMRSLAKSLRPVVQITLTGGSPELRSDLAEIALTMVRYCQPLNMTLCSNGNSPEKLGKIVTEIMSQAPGLNLTVDISLDGLGAEHDQLRRLPGLFSRVLASYVNLANLRERYPGLRLGAGICVTGLNRQSAFETARWAIDHLPIDNLTPILVRGETPNPQAAHGDPEVFLNIAKEVEKCFAKGRLRGYAAFPTLVNAKDVVQKELIAAIAAGGRSPVRCSAARETAVVYPDGTVAGCEIRPEILGNLREADMDLGRVWRSQTTKRFRRSIRRENCFCWHQCFLSAAIVKSPVVWGRLLKAMWGLKRYYES